MKLLRVHHIAVICSEYARSKDFYTRVLGFEVLREEFRAQRGSWKLDLLGPGGVQIELFAFPGAPPRATLPEACGLRHLAFEVASVDDAAAELAGQGVEVEPVRLDSTTGKRFTFFRDPDGLPLEVYER